MDFPRAARRGCARQALAAAACAAVAAAAAAAPRAEGPFALLLAPGGADERCLRLAAGARIDYEFKASAPVDFNLHYHRGAEVVFPVQVAATRGLAAQGFQAHGTDDYCLMWENRGSAPVEVRGRLTRPR